MTMRYETCCECGCKTGRTRRHDDSLYIEDDGPYCEDCYEQAVKTRREESAQFGVGA